jgi:hypothetical protein
MHTMKNVLNFLEDHVISDEVIILGQCPSSKTQPFKNGTFARLKSWCDEVGLHEWDFHNVIPDKINSYSINDVNSDLLITRTKNKTKVIALGNFVSRVCTKYNVDHFKIDHPSPRNRNLNNKDYEKAMIERLRIYVNT